MYLSDNELVARLQEENLDKKLIITPSPEGVFNPADQIGTCSIDLKVSSQIWLEKTHLFGRGRLIDLGNTFNDRQIHTKYWKEKSLSADGYILKPGQRVLAKIDERIEIPQDCLGKIEARSGINRLLLIVTLGDFINPGYKGNYPLQIINMSKHKIKVYPQMSVCQLLLSEISSLPQKKFTEVLSSYQNDNGGPACWWEDRQLKLFLKGNASIEQAYYIKQIIELSINNELSDYRSEMLSRFGRYYKKCKQRNGSLSDPVNAFLNEEKRSANRAKLIVGFLKGLRPFTWLGTVGSLGSLVATLGNFNRLPWYVLYIIFGFIAAAIVYNIVSIPLIHTIEQQKYLIVSQTSNSKDSE